MSTTCNTPAAANRELEQLAELCGVATVYDDVFSRPRYASVESLLAVLNALGVEVRSPDDVPRALAEQSRAVLERGIEPVIVAWDGATPEFDVTLPADARVSTLDCHIEPEAGENGSGVVQRVEFGSAAPRPSPCGQFVTRRVRLARGVEDGYYRLTLATSGSAAHSLRHVRPATLISAPELAFGNTTTMREWGVFLPVYACREPGGTGTGNFRDLHQLSDWIVASGGNVVGTLPLLASYLDEPCDPSPYAPASRLAWNEFYLVLPWIAEWSDCAAARDRSDALASQLDPLSASEFVEYRPLMAAKRQVLELLARHFFQNRPQQRFQEFQQFLQQHPHVEDYSTFRAAVEQRRETWPSWPLPQRNGDLTVADFDLDRKQYHMYVQWNATRQLESLATRPETGLYLDLPVGVRPDGYDVWRFRDAYADGASVGCPPDAVWTKGQDWSFPPFHPARLRERGYRHYRDILTHHMRLARMLRIDHVMQLQRLYWIPHGMPADRGVFVRYLPEEFFAVLNVESHRHRTLLIGENLGTVPPEVDRAMDRHNMQRMYVVQYEIAAQELESRETSATSAAVLRPVPPGALACINTHDMPMFSSWWHGQDIELRRKLRLLTEQDAERELGQLEHTRQRLTAWFQAQGWLDGTWPDELGMLMAILRFLAASPASVVLVNLEDLWLEDRPQNIPGTGSEQMNWRRKARLGLDEVQRRRDVLWALNMVNGIRRGIPFRTPSDMP